MFILIDKAPYVKSPIPVCSFVLKNNEIVPGDRRERFKSRKFPIVFAEISSEEEKRSLFTKFAALVATPPLLNPFNRSIHRTCDKLIRLSNNKPTRFFPMAATEFILRCRIRAAHLRELATLDISALRFDDTWHSSSPSARRAERFFRTPNGN